MFKSCYELNIEFNENYKKRASEVFDEIKSSAQKYIAPDCRRSDYPELWEPLGPLADWVSPKVRILNHVPSELGTAKIHLDVNEHGQFENILSCEKLSEPGEWHNRLNQFVIIQGSINIPLFESKGEVTRWYRPTKPGVMHPYDFWLGKDHSMAVIDEFQIQAKPVLFRTGIWHSVDSVQESKRLMLSFSANYTVDWDTLVMVAKNENILINRS